MNLKRSVMNNENYMKLESALADSFMTPMERQQQMQEKALLDALQSMRITPTMNLPPVEFLFQMLDKPCFPRGELVSVTGKAKSGKTFFLSLLMAACTAGELLGIRRTSSAAPLKCLWYDTEQSRQSTLEILKERIMPLVAASAGSDCFDTELYDVFNTRNADCEQRLSLLEVAISHCQPDLVVVDGICDLVSDINDGVRVKPVVERLMTLAQEANCCIVCAIHQNKNAEDRSPRGWLGTELNNKSFEVYACELLKPQMIFAVEQCLSRRYRMDSQFYFTVDEQGMPHRSEAPQETADSCQETRRATYPPMNDKYISWQDNQMVVDLRSLFCDVLKSGPLYYTDLQTAAMSLLNCKDSGYWNKLFKDAKNQCVIQKSVNSVGKSVWKLSPPAAPAATPELFTERDESPPY